MRNFQLELKNLKGKLTDKYFLYIFPLFLGLCSSSISQAQQVDSVSAIDIESQNYKLLTAKKKWLIGFDFGMGIGIRNQNINFSSATALVDFNLSPRVGMYLGKGWLCGVDFDYFASVASFNFQNEYRFLLRSYNGFTRYYSPSGFLLELTAGYGNGNEKFIRSGETQSIGFEGYRYGVGVGIANYWSQRVSFDILLKYTGSTGNYKEVQDSFFINGLSLGAGVSISLGK
jgi:hypothetical protein